MKKIRKKQKGFFGCWWLELIILLALAILCVISYWKFLYEY